MNFQYYEFNSNLFLEEVPINLHDEPEFADLYFEREIINVVRGV